MERKNPFESLRVPGVVGNVAARNFNVTTIYAQGATATLQIRTAKLNQDAWGFGFYLQMEEDIRQMLPGEASGWFRSESDAMLYALGHIRYGSAPIHPDMKMAADAAISKIRNVPLFEL